MRPPIQVFDGNNNVTNYTYDKYGQLETYTSPRNVTTTYTRDYSRLPLGELKQIQEGRQDADLADLLRAERPVAEREPCRHPARPAPRVA